MLSLLLFLSLLQVVGTVEQVGVSDAWGVVDEEVERRLTMVGARACCWNLSSRWAVRVLKFGLR